MRAESNKPNIVFILGDNVGWGDIGCYGGLAPTPRIDALTSQGLRFRNYNVEAQCTPTCSAVLTGRLPIRTGNVACRSQGRTVAQRLGALAQSAARYPHIAPGQEFTGYA